MPRKMSDDPCYMTPSKKQEREMLQRILKLLHKDGLKGAYIVRGALFPSIQIDVPRKNGDFTTYDLKLT